METLSGIDPIYLPNRPQGSMQVEYSIIIALKTTVKTLSNPHWSDSRQVARRCWPQRLTGHFPDDERPGSLTWSWQWQCHVSPRVQNESAFLVLAFGSTMRVRYLLSIQTSTVSFYAYVALACNVEAAFLDLFHLPCIRIGSNNFFYFGGSNLYGSCQWQILITLRPVSSE